MDSLKEILTYGLVWIVTIIICALAFPWGMKVFAWIMIWFGKYVEWALN